MNGIQIKYLEQALANVTQMESIIKTFNSDIFVHMTQTKHLELRSVNTDSTKNRKMFQNQVFTATDEEEIHSFQEAGRLPVARAASGCNRRFEEHAK